MALKLTTEMDHGNDGIQEYDDQIFDDSPCSFTNSDGVVVLKEIISYFDDSSWQY